MRVRLNPGHVEAALRAHAPGDQCAVSEDGRDVNVATEALVQVTSGCIDEHGVIVSSRVAGAMRRLTRSTPAERRC